MALITELILVWHGEAHCNVMGLVGGPRTCIGLTDAGRDRVARLATRLGVAHAGGQPIDTLYITANRRIAETAIPGHPFRPSGNPEADGQVHHQAGALLWRPPPFPVTSDTKPSTP